MISWLIYPAFPNKAAPRRPASAPKDAETNFVAGFLQSAKFPQRFGTSSHSPGKEFNPPLTVIMSGSKLCKITTIALATSV
jgi:hypothetical protein